MLIPPTQSHMVHRALPRARFGTKFQGTAEPMTSEAMKAAADEFRRAAQQAQGMPGSDHPDWTPLTDLMAQFLNGNAAFARDAIRSLTDAMTGQKSQRSCEIEIVNNQPAYRVKSGVLNRLFTKRRLCSANNSAQSLSLSFSQFLEEKFGRNKRVIISITGWTKPPVEPLMQDPIHRKLLERLKPEERPKYAESLYVSIVKKYLDDVIRMLKEELGEQFNPVEDLAFIYGVTPEGVDRAVEEYAMKSSIPLVGLTAYDWAEFIPDEAGKPDVFLATDPKEFGHLMADSSNKLVITGGRSFAARVNINGSTTEVARRTIPVDLMRGYGGINIPAVVADEDDPTQARIVNAAKLIKELGADPWKLKVVQRAKNNRHTDNEEAFVTAHILKAELKKLYEIRELEKQFERQLREIQQRED